jgi:hypothetical protein
VSGSHPRGLSVQCRHWLAALAGHSLSYPTAWGVCASVLDLTTAVSALRLAFNAAPSDAELTVTGRAATYRYPVATPGLLRLRRKGTCAGVPAPVSQAHLRPARAGCRGCLPSLPRVRFAGPARGSTPCLQPLGQECTGSGSSPFRTGAGSEGAPACAPLLSVRFRGWHQRHHSLLHKQQQHQRQGAEVQCRRHHSLLRRAAARHCSSEGCRCPPPSPAWPNGHQHGPQWAELKGRQNPTSHHAVVKAKLAPIPTGGSHVPAADSLQQLSRPPLSPGLSGSCCPTPPSATAAEAPRPQSPSARPHQASVGSTPTTGSSTKRSMAVALSPHMACAAIHEPPHRMTISLLAMPSIHVQCSSQSRYHRAASHPQERPRGT